jgi:hypothetical protein
VTSYLGLQQPYTGRYRNWRGEVRTRTITPLQIWYGANQWHPEPQWLIRALDQDGHIKDFALSGFLGDEK